jgi:hypothetical protein
MLDVYDLNQKFGVHTIEVTLQHWEYKGLLRVKIGGNCKGFSVINEIVNTIFNAYPDIESNCNFMIIEDSGDAWFEVKLKNKNNEILLVDGDFDSLEELIVKVEIIDFIPENA